MLSFRLHCRAISANWKSTGQVWKDCDNIIAPYKHPALETIAACCGDRLLFGVRERLRDTSSPVIGAGADHLPEITSAALDALRLEFANWPLHRTTIEIDTGSVGTSVRIQAGEWGVAPVYLADKGEVLLGHWDPSELYCFLPDIGLDPEHAAHYLVQFSTPYSKNSLLRGINVLTAGSTATWRANGGASDSLDIEYPPAFPGYRPRELKLGAPVLEQFGAILEASQRRWVDDDLPSSELSGGLDSGIVSATAAMIHDGHVHTYGIIHDGAMGMEQRSRREELVARYNLIDHVTLAGRHLPLDPTSSRISESRVVPWEEIYYEAVEALLSIAVDTGTRVLFTGFGGDELFYPNWEEIPLGKRLGLLHEFERGRPDRPDWISTSTYETFRESLQDRDAAPAAAISDSALDSVAFASILYLKKGIWPVNPYCTPELIRFCRSLPFEWRENRNLQRQFLRRLGLSDRYIDPKLPESFTPVLERGLRRHKAFIDDLFEDSRLAAQGHIDPRRFLAAFADFTERGSTRFEPKDYYATIVLELTLRSWEERLQTGLR